LKYLKLDTSAMSIFINQITSDISNISQGGVHGRREHAVTMFVFVSR
jgi:hypothetical protein